MQAEVPESQLMFVMWATLQSMERALDTNYNRILFSTFTESMAVFKKAWVL